MTDNSPPNQPSTPTPGTPAGQPAKKSRSPIERAVVWGAILILLGVAGVQLLAWYDYDQTTRPLRLRVREADDSDKEVKESEVKDLVKGNPSVVSWRRGPMPSYLWIRGDGKDVASDEPPDLYSRASRVDHYTWHGVLKNYSTRVHYGVHGDGKEPVVIEIDNPDVPAEPDAPAKAPDTPAAAQPGDTAAASGTPGTSGDAGGAGGPGAKKGKKKKTDDASEQKTDASADKTEKSEKKDVKEDAKPEAKDAPADSKATPAQPKETKPE